MKTFLRFQTCSIILPIAATIVGAALACSTGSGPSGGSGNHPASGGGSVGSGVAGSSSTASGGALVVDAGSGGSTTNSRPDLPPPWQYTDGSGASSYKDAS